MQYLVLAFDNKDDEAGQRRRDAQPAHVTRAAGLKLAGELHIGGPILDDEGRHIGSAQFVEFDSEEGIERYVNDDPFTKGKVWQDVKVFKVLLRECRCVAQLRDKLCTHQGRGVDVVNAVATALVDKTRP